VSQKHVRGPVLNRLYHEYLQTEDSASFILAVSQRYTIGTLHRIVQTGGRIERRAAVMAIGFLGGDESCRVLSRALADTDRGVRMLADNGIRAVWCRAGNEAQRHWLRVIMRLNLSGQHEAAHRRATNLIREAPHFAEAWNQRAIARYHLGRYMDSIEDCTQTLKLNPFHFGAAAGIGQSYLRLGALSTALQNFRRALRLNPGLEAVRAKITSLQRALEDR
jgi:tetratricopeptide (TPR) repeat protein